MMEQVYKLLTKKLQVLEELILAQCYPEVETIKKKTVTARIKSSNNGLGKTLLKVTFVFISAKPSL